LIDALDGKILVLAKVQRRLVNLVKKRSDDNLYETVED